MSLCAPARKAAWRLGQARTGNKTLGDPLCKKLMDALGLLLAPADGELVRTCQEGCLATWKGLLWNLYNQVVGRVSNQVGSQCNDETADRPCFNPWHDSLNPLGLGTVKLATKRLADSEPDSAKPVSNDSAWAIVHRTTHLYTASVHRDYDKGWSPNKTSNCKSAIMQKGTMSTCCDVTDCDGRKTVFDPLIYDTSPNFDSTFMQS